MTKVEAEIETYGITPEDENLWDRRQKQLKETKKKMDEKRYVCTIYQEGDELMSEGDWKRQAMMRRMYSVCSTNEVIELLECTHQTFWTHPDLLADHSNANEIPVEEKKWGIYTDVIIEPFTEELEQSYLAGSKNGFFKMQREYHDYKMKEVA